jgi:hypothetical protein
MCAGPRDIVPSAAVHHLTFEIWLMAFAWCPDSPMFICMLKRAACKTRLVCLAHANLKEGCISDYAHSCTCFGMRWQPIWVQRNTFQEDGCLHNNNAKHAVVDNILLPSSCTFRKASRSLCRTSLSSILSRVHACTRRAPQLSHRMSPLTPKPEMMCAVHSTFACLAS